jgi:hypothetical protein
MRLFVQNQNHKAPAAELRWLAPPEPTGLVFRPVCFGSLLITKRTRRQKGQGDKKDSALLIASA